MGISPSDEPRALEQAYQPPSAMVDIRPHSASSRHSGLSCCPASPKLPNAGAHLLPEAAATQERRLEAVRCSALFGADLGQFPSWPPHVSTALGKGARLF